MHKLLTLVTISLLPVFSPTYYLSAAIYRCTDLQGQLMFRDTPCPSSTSHSDNRYIPESSITSLKHLTLKKTEPIQKKKKKKKPLKDCPFFSSTELRTLRVKQEYKQGLPAAEITKRLGPPLNKENTGTEKETWTYRLKHSKITFRFKHKCLVRWSEKKLIKR